MKPKIFYGIIPRPTVVITTISPKGISNAAPFSFNSPVSIKPPMFGFSCQPTHDTWRNLQENKEFVVNLISRDFGELMHILEKDFPYEVSEIEKASLTEIESEKVKPPRIKEACGFFECEMVHHVELGDHVWITGKVLLAEVDREIYDRWMKSKRANSLLHLSGSLFATDLKLKKFKRS